MSAWKADIPFPAEDLGTCRGCDARIGWVRSEDDRPHPVEARGWEGVPCAEGWPGSRKGRTLDGDVLTVREPDPVGPSLFDDRSMKNLAVVFESHFKHCPNADRFFASTRNKDRRAS